MASSTAHPRRPSCPHGGHAPPETGEGLPRGRDPKKHHSSPDEEPTGLHRPGGPSPGSKHKVLVGTENEREKRVDEEDDSAGGYGGDGRPDAGRRPRHGRRRPRLLRRLRL